MVSPYPPWRDGIGAYAVQQVRALRRLGHHVEVVSPYPSAAHHHLDLDRATRRARPRPPGPPVRSRRWCSSTPTSSTAVPATPGSRIAEGLALGAAFRAGPPVEIRLHEVDHRWADRSDPSARATQFLFRSADRVTVHVPDHHALMVDRFGVPPIGSRWSTTASTSSAGSTTTEPRPEQRSASPTTTTSSCASASSSHTRASIGPSRRFAGSASAARSLHVVGAVRVDDPTAADHLRELEHLARQVARRPSAPRLRERRRVRPLDRGGRHRGAPLPPHLVLQRGRACGAVRPAGHRDPSRWAGRPAGEVRRTPRWSTTTPALARAMRSAVAGQRAYGTPADADDAGGACPRRLGVRRAGRPRHRRGGDPQACRRGPGRTARSASATATGARSIEIAPSAPLRRLRPVPPPAPVSARPGRQPG